MVPLESRMMELVNMAKDEKTYEAHQKDLKTYCQRYDFVKVTVVDAITQAKLPPTPLVTAPPAGAGAAAAAAPNQTASFIKPNIALKPKELTPENTPLEMRAWTSKFRSFYSTSHFDKCTIEDQQAYFLECLDPVLRFRIESKIDIATEIFGRGSCMSAVSYTHLTLPTILLV